MTAKSRSKKIPFRPTWAEVDLRALRRNFAEIKRCAQKTGILAVIKADAYGHGMVKVAQSLIRQGVDFLGVADVREGFILRQSGINKPILLFEHSLPSHAREVIDFNLTPSVSNLELAESLNRYAKSLKRFAGVH